MARSHPPAVLKSAERTLLGECGVSRKDRILLAVSGGIDSMCLLHVLGRLREKLGFELVAHGVDHGLRPEAKAELDVAAGFAEQQGIEFGRSKVVLKAGGNIQHRAREARYRALELARKKANATLIATAHHADDRAETVLLRLLRGSGPVGLGVLPARAGDRIRPLIRVRRSEIVKHVERHGINCSSDPSNEDRRYLRSQVRHDLMPHLVQMSPAIVTHLNALADALSMDALTGEAQPLHRSLGLNRAQLQALKMALEKGLPGPRIAVSERLELRLERADPVRSGRNRSDR